jgi:hypothetical protein
MVQASYDTKHASSEADLPLIRICSKRVAESICLLAGLHVVTNLTALRAVFGTPNLAIRYYKYRFHAEIFLFDTCD